MCVALSCAKAAEPIHMPRLHSPLPQASAAPRRTPRRAGSQRPLILTFNLRRDHNHARMVVTHTDTKMKVIGQLV